MPRSPAATTELARRLPMNIPVMLSIAGSDCSAGAGIQADMKAAAAMGVYGLTAVTCVVAEVPGQVESIQPVDPAVAAAQTRLCLDTFPVAAVKTGMLYSPEIVEAVAGELKERSLPLVVDPVMIATAGNTLMLESALAVYERSLLPLTTLLTPNLDELARLLGRPVEGEEGLRRGARELAHRYDCAVLAKGGHLAGSCCDVLALPDGGERVWRRERIEGISTHGTGCTLSAAIAARLAQGDSLGDAVEMGLGYVANAIARSLRWESPRRVEALKHGI